VYVGRILERERPADLAIQQSTKIELIADHAAGVRKPPRHEIASGDSAAAVPQARKLPAVLQALWGFGGSVELDRHDHGAQRSTEIVGLFEVRI
jgi:hypothetical protein